MPIVDRQIEPAVAARHSPKLKQPRIREIIDMCENRPGIDAVESVVGKW